jgi:arylsulfatase A-like enzyme
MPITRRQLAAIPAPLLAQTPAASRRPNILVVFSDDHSVPFIGCYGHPTIKTPNLDRFASEGMRFNRMFTAAPQCVPSRAAYMTGRSPVAVRMGRFASPLPPDVPALPDLLRAQGYFTGICRRSFHLDGAGAGQKVTAEILERNNMLTFQNRVDWLIRNSPRAETENNVNEFLGKVPAGKPFFLWVNFNDPHHVWDRNAIPEPHDPAKLPLPAHLPDLPGMRDDLGRYCDEVARMDGEFQSILRILDARGLRENTLVVFAGDNGMAFPHGKGSLYDPGLNVPLLIRWPGVVKPGAVTDQLVSGEDLTPTMLEAAGAPVPKAMSGRSYLGLLKADPAFRGRTEVFAARLHHGQGNFTAQSRASHFDLSRMVRTATHKLIYNCTPHMEYWPVDSGNDAGWRETLAAHQAGKLDPKLESAYFTRPRPVYELYDLRSDPSELTNLAGRPEHQQLIRELKIKLQEKMITDYDFLPLPLAE